MNLSEKKTEIMTIVQRIQSGTYDDFLGYLQDKNDLEKCLDQLINYAQGYKQGKKYIINQLEKKSDITDDKDDGVVVLRLSDCENYIKPLILSQEQ